MKNMNPVRKKISVRIATLVATFFGAGLSPWAPGTMGTLAALPLAYLTSQWDSSVRILFWVAIFFLGSWAAKVFDQSHGSSDNQAIVIDEVLGLGIASFTAGNQWEAWVLAFVFFRFFDILKPFPIRKLDRWSKNQSNPYWKGAGVVLDDVVAGFEALVLVIAAQRLIL